MTATSQLELGTTVSTACTELSPLRGIRFRHISSAGTYVFVFSRQTSLQQDFRRNEHRRRSHRAASSPTTPPVSRPAPGPRSQLSPSDGSVSATPSRSDPSSSSPGTSPRGTSPVSPFSLSCAGFLFFLRLRRRCFGFASSSCAPGPSHCQAHGLLRPHQSAPPVVPSASVLPGAFVRCES